MKIRAFRTIQDGKYRVTLITGDLSSDELRRIREQGDPEVDTGGSFTEGEVSFSLPNRLVPVLSGFASPGFTKSFDLADNDEAQDLALIWQDTVQTRIIEAMRDLKDADVADFENETVTSVTYP